MTLGRMILDALTAQGFDVHEGPHEVVITSPDRRRRHSIPRTTFREDTYPARTALRIVVVGLEQLEGFVAPPGYWPGL